jgi:Phage QLRG family, putative DNA packaging.
LIKIKAQCRIEPDFDDENEILELYGESAEDAILEMLERSYEDLYEVYGRIPAPIVHASLLLVAKGYKDRESDLVQETHDNKTFSFLLKPYMRLASPTINGQNQNQYGCKNL